MKGKIIVIAFEFTDIMGVVGEGCCTDYHRGQCTHGKDDQALSFPDHEEEPPNVGGVDAEPSMGKRIFSKINYFITS
ncbi:hypothetical protein Gotur_024187 [Gossypium turneri]